MNTDPRLRYADATEDRGIKNGKTHGANYRKEGPCRSKQLAVAVAGAPIFTFTAFGSAAAGLIAIVRLT